MSDVKKLFEALIFLLIFITVAPIALDGLTGWNLTGWSVLDGVVDILAIVFIFGLGVYGIGRMVGLI